MAEHTLRFPYAKRMDVFAHLSELSPVIQSGPTDPARRLREGECVVVLRITPPQLGPAVSEPSTDAPPCAGS